MERYPERPQMLGRVLKYCAARLMVCLIIFLAARDQQLRETGRPEVPLKNRVQGACEFVYPIRSWA